MWSEEAGRGKELLQEPTVQDAPPPPKKQTASTIPAAEMKGLSLGDGAPTAATEKEAAAKKGLSGQK